jgi:hypothetical protein
VVLGNVRGGVTTPSPPSHPPIYSTTSVNLPHALIVFIASVGELQQETTILKGSLKRNLNNEPSKMNLKLQLQDQFQNGSSNYVLLAATATQHRF